MTEVSSILANVFLFVSLYFEIFLLMTFFEKRSEMKEHDKDPAFYPTVTVCVPAFNEEKTISKTIESLLSLNYPKDKLSIFLVDDGSTDSTWKVMESYKTYPGISVFQKENGGKHTALNLAIEKSSSHLIGCLDADSFVERDALKRIVKRFENPKTQAVIAAIQVYNPKNILERIQSVEYMFSAFIRKTLSYLGANYITPGPFSFFRRKIFAEIGPYRKAHHTEDLEIALRMQLAHMRIDNAHDAYVYTVSPKTFLKLYKQRVRWIHGFLENMRDHKYLYFKKGHGHLTMFILPLATLSIFSALFFTGLALVSAFSFFVKKLVEYDAVGFSLLFGRPSFDWFYISTETAFMMGWIVVALTIVLILIGKYIAEKKISFNRDILYFIALYSFLAPFWLAKSVYNTILSRKTSWR